MKKDKIILSTGGKIVLSAGGTGGHVFPAIALADELILRGKKVAFITDKRGEKYLKNTNYKYYKTVIEGKKIHKLVLSIFQAFLLLIKLKPYRVVGFGGYPSFPALFAANILCKKTFVHEQNSVLGKVNKFFATKNNVATSFPKMSGKLVGNPVRKEIIRTPFPLVEDKINILITGGSQGAKIFSEVLPEAFLKFKKEIRVTQQVVPAELERIKSFYKLNRIEAEVATFFNDMPRRYAENHLVICRSGSSTIFELATAGRPAIFVPLAIAADNHQQLNAEAVANTEGAWIILEKDFTKQAVTKLLQKLTGEPAHLYDAANHITKFAVSGAAKKLADFILK